MNHQTLLCFSFGLLFVLTACDDSSDTTSPNPSYDLIFEGYLQSTAELLLLDSDLDTVRKLLPLETTVMDPTPSPDGTRIAFVVADYTQWTGDIYVINRDGSGLQRLTSAPQLDDQPAWSPDGERIVFRSYRTERDGDIWIMNADGSNAINLTPDPLPGIWDERRPTWSPDGARIAYATNAAGNVDIWTMLPDGTDQQQITSSAELETEPAWSPDGTLIAYRSSGGADSDIYLVPAAGGTPLPITLAGEQRLPTWTPGGNYIVFVNQPSTSDRPDLYSVRTDGTDLQPLVTDEVPGGSVNPAFLKRR
jgi:Tol biopolymer transport system component